MKTEQLGRIEYELTDDGRRTGRWRPREGSSVAKVGQPQKWRSAKAIPGQEPIE